MKKFYFSYKKLSLSKLHSTHKRKRVSGGNYLPNMKRCLNNRTVQYPEKVIDNSRNDDIFGALVQTIQNSVSLLNSFLPTLPFSFKRERDDQQGCVLHTKRSYLDFITVQNLKKGKWVVGDLRADVLAVIKRFCTKTFTGSNSILPISEVKLNSVDMTADFEPDIDSDLKCYSLHIFSLLYEYMGLKDIQKFEVSGVFISENYRELSQGGMRWHRDFLGQVDFIVFFYFGTSEKGIPDNTNLSEVADISHIPEEERNGRDLQILIENQFAPKSNPEGNTVIIINNKDAAHRAPAKHKIGHILRLGIKVIE